MRLHSFVLGLAVAALVVLGCVSQGNQRGSFSFVENPEKIYPANFSWNVDSKKSGEAVLTVFDQDNPNVIVLTHKFALGSQSVSRDAKIVKTNEPVPSATNPSFELMFIVEEVEEKEIVSTVADLYKDGKVFGTYVLTSQEESKPQVANPGPPPKLGELPFSGPNKWRGPGRPPKD